MNLIKTFAIILTLVGCHEKKILESNDNSNHFLGEWNLTNVSGGFSSTENFEINVVKWEFLMNDTVHITLQQDINENSKVPFKVDTLLTYSYNSNKIIIGGDVYEYHFDNTQLHLLDNPSSDGVILTFEAL